MPDLAGLPRDAEGAPVFAEPWQARAFALAVGLHAKGAFAWPAFAARLAIECARDPRADYYVAWLWALEAQLAASGLAERSEVMEVATRWQRAAAATPHGEPIRLERSDGMTDPVDARWPWLDEDRRKRIAAAEQRIEEVLRRRRARIARKVAEREAGRED